MIHYIYGETDVPYVEDVMEDVNRYINLSDSNYWELDSISGSTQKKLQKKMEAINGKYIITLDRPLGVAVGFKAKMSLLAKRVVRKLSRWYVSDLAEQQTEYNKLVTQYLNRELPMLFAMNREILAMKKELKEIRHGSIPEQFYVDFENAFHGDQTVNRARLEKYAALFQGKQNVVDLNCGRGDFLTLMSEHEIPAKGVDPNGLMVEQCRQKGMQAEKKEALSFLEGCETESLDGLFAGRLVDNLTAGKVYLLIQEAYRVLKKDGVFVVEAINPLSMGTFGHNCSMDPAHRAPVHPELMRFMAQSLGFEAAAVAFVDEFPAECKLTVGENADENLKEVVDKLNDQLYGAQDYYLVCKKTGVKDHES